MVLYYIFPPDKIGCRKEFSILMNPIIIYLITLLISFFVFIVIMVAPGRYTKKMAAPFRGRYFAHRGLHTKDKSIPENSMRAFEEACKAGYGMEMDVQLTKDRQVVVFHDDDLERVCGVEGLVSDYTYEELQEFRLEGTEERIPLFKDVLDCIAGREPIIVELKSDKMRFVLCQEVMYLLAPYTGDYCLESFDPAIVKWVKKNMPGVLRGQLSAQPDFFSKVSGIGKIFISNCMFGLMNRPHFIAYRVGPKPFTIKLTKLLGAMHICWTSRPEDMGGTPEIDAANNDSVIFEFYTPPTHIEK